MRYGLQRKKTDGMFLALLHLITIVFPLSSISVAQNLSEPDKWKLADGATVRLSPRSFHQLPHSITRSLQARRCTIPQSFGTNELHNVISGEFIMRGQKDWAILCSRKRSSSILVFWGGSARRVFAIAPSPDSAFMQTISGGGRIGFSRAIGAVGRDYILKHYHEYGGPAPSAIDHQGIADAFVEKASVVHYYYHGRWLELQGAD